MKRPRLGILLFLLSLLAISWMPASPAQSATRPAPPATAVFEVEAIEQWGEPGSSSFQSWYNLTFQLSEQDPDQSTGSFDYYLWHNGTRVPASALTLNAVPDRPGWVYFPNDFAGSAGDSGVYELQLTANNTAGEESIWSCSLVIAYRSNNSHVQCGPTIAAPTGVRAVVERESSEASSAIVNVSYRVSDDDPDGTAGSYTYWAYAQGEMTDVQDAGVSERARFAIDTTPGVDGIRSASHEPFLGFGTFTFTYDVVAVDDFTHQRSDPSCRVAVSPNRMYDSAGCGSLSGGASGPTSGGVTFPFTNISQATESTGMSEATVGAFFAVATVMGIAGIGFALGGIVTAGIGAIVGFAFSALLGLVPLYVTVLVFLGAVTVVALRLKGGSG